MPASGRGLDPGRRAKDETASACWPAHTARARTPGGECRRATTRTRNTQTTHQRTAAGFGSVLQAREEPGRARAADLAEGCNVAGSVRGREGRGKAAGARLKMAAPRKRTSCMQMNPTPPSTPPLTPRPPRARPRPRTETALQKRACLQTQHKTLSASDSLLALYFCNTTVGHVRAKQCGVAACAGALKSANRYGVGARVSSGHLPERHWRFGRGLPG